jgi:hypothetical protein
MSVDFPNVSLSLFVYKELKGVWLEYDGVLGLTLNLRVLDLVALSVFMVVNSLP